MNSISCVIPTLWMASETPELFDQLNGSSVVKDIIVIDNSIKDRTVDFNKYGIKEILPPIKKYEKVIPVEKYGKFRVLIPESNIYVTEPWNIGVLISRHDAVCLLNDDVIPDSKVFNIAIKHISKNIGLIGVNCGVFYNSETREEIKQVTTRPLGYGFCLFFHKSKYIEIPTCIKVWYNDDYLFEKVQGKHYCFTGAKIRGTMSKTNHSPVMQDLLNPIRAQDFVNYTNIMKNDKL